MKCRFCNDEVTQEFLNLENQPLSNGYLSEKCLSLPEVTYPLKLLICKRCLLVQTQDYASADQIFTSDYAYFSSTSSGWLAHAKDYATEIIKRQKLDQSSMVVEIASNDGYLLKNFVAKGIPCVGIEPTESTAKAAKRVGVPTITKFFGNDFAVEFVQNYGQADLVIGNNVFAHVPDINDFVEGLVTILKPDGIITLEFPHLMKMVQFNQFDTAYHEHFSYFSFYVAKQIFEKAGLRIFDVESLDTHGGSIRVFGCLKDAIYEEENSVSLLLNSEIEVGMTNLEYYKDFQAHAISIKNELLKFLLKVKEDNKRVVAYGAAAKGNTILNYAGIKSDLLPVVYDASKSKQGKFLPGSHIPISDPSNIMRENVDYILILPWNIADEICDELSDINKKGAKFVIAVPKLRII